MQSGFGLLEMGTLNKGGQSIEFQSFLTKTLPAISSLCMSNTFLFLSYPGNSMPGFEVNILTKNVVDVVLGSLSYWLLGYGISYGRPSNPFMGLGDFLVGSTPYDPTESGLVYSQYLFQFSFAATATTIVSGCIAMRMRFGIYCFYSLYAVIVYAFVAHWVWAESGWLKQLGVHDFAGGGPVHLFGGTNGFIAVLFVGARTGYFNNRKKRNRIDFAPTSASSTLFGLFMLWWGWIGFNCGSTFGITGIKWTVASRAGITTINSTAGGGIVSLLYTLIRTNGKQIRVRYLVNGILGSLVASSPSCAAVHTWAAFIIGAVGALTANLVNSFLKRRKFDDPVGSVGVHAGGGVWGLLAVGLFADSKLPGIDIKSDGLFWGAGFQLLGLQLLAIVVIMGWSMVCVAPFFYMCGVALSRNLQNPREGLRIGVKEEVEGEDKHLHGIDNPWTYDHSMRFTNYDSEDDEGDGVDADSSPENKHSDQDGCSDNENRAENVSSPKDRRRRSALGFMGTRPQTAALDGPSAP
jgi:ammonium transporter